MSEKGETGGLRAFNQERLEIGVKTCLVNSDDLFFQWGGSLGSHCTAFE